MLGDVGPVPPGREPVEVDHVGDEVRRDLGHLEHQPAALAVADHRQRPAADRVDHREGVADVRLPAVEVGPIGVAVAAVVPRHHPPALGGEQRREHVEGAGEVEPAVRQEHRWSVRVAPLDDGDADAVGVDAPEPVGAPSPGEGHGHRRHVRWPGLLRRRAHSVGPWPTRRNGCCGVAASSCRTSSTDGLLDPGSTLRLHLRGDEAADGHRHRARLDPARGRPGVRGAVAGRERGGGRRLLRRLAPLADRSRDRPSTTSASSCSTEAADDPDHADDHPGFVAALVGRRARLAEERARA